MVSGTDGLDMLQTLHTGQDETPILMLAARDAVEDRVTGLNVGADDYLAKPFVPAELVARVNALLRRDSPGDQEPLSFWPGPSPLLLCSGCSRKGLCRYIPPAVHGDAAAPIPLGTVICKPRDRRPGRGA